MRKRARNRFSVGRCAGAARRNRRENRPAFLGTKKSACPIAREALPSKNAVGLDVSRGTTEVEIGRSFVDDLDVNG